MKKKLIIIIIGAVVLLGGGTAAAVVLLKPAPEPIEGEEIVEELVEEPLYYSISPKFTITYNTATGLRYLQLSMDVMSYEQEALDDVKQNMPAVRNNVLLLLSGQEFSSLANVEGKQMLRAAVLETIQESSRSEALLQEVYFTDFIMQ